MPLDIVRWQVIVYTYPETPDLVKFPVHLFEALIESSRQERGF